jgi:hypothetical protein
MKLARVESDNSVCAPTWTACCFGNVDDVGKQCNNGSGGLAGIYARSFLDPKIKTGALC